MKNDKLKLRATLIDESIDFVDGFKHFLPKLKKAGSNYRCSSPFKKEQYPSFFVSPNKFIWHCFSTGIGGRGLISYVMKKDDMTFHEAIDHIETEFGLKKSGITKKSLVKLVKRLKKKPYDNQGEKLVRVYERQFLNFIEKFKKTYKDKYHIMLPMVEEIWDRFDTTTFNSYSEFREFLKESYIFIKDYRDKVVKPSNRFVKQYMLTH